MSKLRYITRYLLHKENMNDEENYRCSVEWMNKNHTNFDESCYSNLIADAIKKASKYPFYNIENIKITQSELDIISSLDNFSYFKLLLAIVFHNTIGKINIPSAILIRQIKEIDINIGSFRLV